MAITSWTAWPGAALALTSAALFGASTPLAKALLGGGFSPWLLAAILYLGSGLGLAAIAVGRRIFGGSRREAPLAGADWSWMALIVLSGGVAGPVLLMIGLATIPASSAALLLNLEGLATMAIAWAVFRENVDRRLLVGAFAILAGALLLSWQGPGAGGAMGAGLPAIAGACLAWGIDNNLTRKVSGADPLQIAVIKGLAAGIVNLALAAWLGASLPGLPILAGAALVGFLGYGVSLVLFVLALRHLGTARTGAYFSMAPFIGAVIALALFGEPVTARLVVAGVLMAIGLWLHLAERHAHEHEHALLEHSHAHVHDAHHQHDHGPGETPSDDRLGEPHVHAHRHTRLVHSHPHYPDLHHRHEH
jgi:drug/metabolite transporter (DMT)-like permease